MKNSQRWNLSLSFSICHDVSKPKSVKRYYTYFNTFCCFLPQFGNPISNGMEIEARDNILLCFWLVSKTHLKMQGRVDWYLRRAKCHWFYLVLCSDGIIRYILCNFYSMSMQNVGSFLFWKKGVNIHGMVLLQAAYVHCPLTGSCVLV